MVRARGADLEPVLEAAQELLEHLGDAGGLERLDEVGVCAGLVPLDVVVLAGACGELDDGRGAVAVVCPDGPHDLEAVRPWEHHVHQGEVERQVPEPVDGFPAVGELDDDVTGRLEHEGDEGRDVAVVLDEEDAHTVSSILVGDGVQASVPDATGGCGGERVDEQVPNRAELDALFRGDGWAEHAGVLLDDWGGGWARVVYVPEPSHRNFGGVVHGGAVFTAGDVAFAVASNSWGRAAVALSIDTHFLAAPAVGEPLTVIASERNRTRRTASYDIVATAPDDSPVATWHAMVFRLGRWHLGEDAWPVDWRATH
jgi:acyl-CoA thioesterase